MRIHVLGAGAGGGFPQWNCNCRNCAGLRAGTLKARARTQSSIAIGDDEGHWLLCNASPDILTQLQHFPGAQPARALRDTALAGVLLIDAQIDHSTGLYMLREHREKLALWCTQPVYEDLTQGNPILRLLAHYCGVDWHCLQADGRSFTVPQLPSLRFAAIPLISNAPPYSPHRDRPVPGDNIGLLVEDIRSGGRLFYAPGLGVMQPAVLDAMCSADVVLVDGTCWQDDELIALGISHKTAREMGHLPQSGEQGMLAQLARLPARTRRILIHINNTNPILDEDSAEHAQLRAQGVELAHDCMEFSL